MNRKKKFWISPSAFILTFIIYIVFCSVFYLFLWLSAKHAPSIQQQELLRFKIYGSSYSNSDGDTISANFSIVDANGNDIAVIERSWPGLYLSVEFNKVYLCGKTFIFPSGVFGREQIIIGRNYKKKSTSLEKYYDEGIECLLYGFGSTLKNRHHLYIISLFANSKIPVIDLGFRTKISVDLSKCEVGRYYSIVKYGSTLRIVEL